MVRGAAVPAAAGGNGKAFETSGKPNFYGVVNVVSVLVSVADSCATKPLPLKRFGLEAEVGIGRFRRADQARIKLNQS
jgi:hypothetical protein